MCCDLACSHRPTSPFRGSVSGDATRREPAMDITACVVSYFTGAGTTRAVSERFAAAVEAAGVPARAADITPHGAEVPAFGPGDLAVFAVPSYGGRVPAPALERLARCEGDDTPAVLVVTFGNRAVDDTFLELADAVRARGFVPVALGAIVAHHSVTYNFLRTLTAG